MPTAPIIMCLACVPVSGASRVAADVEPATSKVCDNCETRDEAGGLKHIVYGEIFGKGGLYGIGYDYLWRPSLGFGVVVSGYEIDSERVVTVNPYVSIYPKRRGHHGLFVQTGPRVIDRRVKSPVPLWDGHQSTSVGAQLSSGYEYRNRIVVRTFLSVVAGKGGVSPWGGLSLGVEL